MNVSQRLSVIVILMIVIPACTGQKNPFQNWDPEWDKVAENLDFPEGPAWDGSKYLYLSNCNGGWITRYHKGVSDTLISRDNSIMKQTNGLTVSGDGFIYACEYGNPSILRISPEGNTTVLADSFANTALNRPNDLAFDKKGNLYFTDPKSYGADKADGRLFRLPEKSNTLELVADSLAFPNGIAFSPLDQQLYVCESARNRILRFTGLPETVVREVFIELPGGDPDGIAFDVQGNLYVAHFGSGSIFIISPEGKIWKRLKAPGKKPTNLEFAGAEMKTLYMTETETNALYTLRVPVAGVKLP